MEIRSTLRRLVILAAVAVLSGCAAERVPPGSAPPQAGASSAPEVTTDEAPTEKGPAAGTGTASTVPETPPPAVAETERSPFNLVIIGASVSAGFAQPLFGKKGRPMTSFRMSRVMRDIWPEGKVAVSDYSDATLFLSPERSARVQVERALRRDPDLVLALDFMFWFGHGGSRGAGFGRDERLARQQVGLEMLDRLDVPLLVGDYPDVTGAHPRICPPWWIPADATRAELNRRLRAWADERPEVQVFPLRDWVARARSDAFVVGGSGRRVSADALLQGDEVHASRLGITLLTGHVLDALLGLGTSLPEPGLQRPWDLELVGRMGVGDDLEEATRR